jgi:phospholipid transport system transporter-binding protein
VIRREGDSLILEGAVTLGTVPNLVDAVEDHLRQGARVVDFRQVTDIDSSAIALALEWLRQARRNNIELRLIHLPTAMLNLAELYGVSELLQAAA